MELKQQAAREALKDVQSGQVLGLGTGSTTRLFVIALGEAWRSGRLERIVGIPTSEATAQLARDYGIPLAPLEAHPTIDLAVDGADEVDPGLEMIKGLGGALLREKAVELRARRFVVIVDDGKLVQKLGTKAPLPVEIEAGRGDAIAPRLIALGSTPTLRGGAVPFVTDNGNHILDCRFPNGIADPKALAATLDREPGVRAHGLFIGMASEVIVASSSGIRRLQRG